MSTGWIIAKNALMYGGIGAMAGAAIGGLKGWNDSGAEERATQLQSLSETEIGVETKYLQLMEEMYDSIRDLSFLKTVNSEAYESLVHTLDRFVALYNILKRTCGTDAYHTGYAGKGLRYVQYIRRLFSHLERPVRQTFPHHIEIFKDRREYIEEKLGKLYHEMGLDEKIHMENIKVS